MMKEEEEEETLFDQEGLLTFKPRTADEDVLWCTKFVKTVVLSISFLALGLCIAIPGPTLLDLGERVGEDVQHMSYIFTARSVGYLLGSLVGGIVFDHFDQQLLLFYTLVLTAIATTAAPWCTIFLTLAIMISFQGFTMGILDTGGNVFCIRIWGKKSGPYMQALHFTFAIGAFIAPLLAKPFLMNPAQLPSLNETANATVGPVAMPIVGSPMIPGSLDREHPRFVRDTLPFLNSSAGDNFTSSTNLTQEENASHTSVMVNFSTTTLQPSTLGLPEPRPKKPDSLTSSALNDKFVDGKMAQDSLSSHKDDKVETLAPKSKATVSPGSGVTTPSLGPDEESSNGMKIGENKTDPASNGTSTGVVPNPGPKVSSASPTATSLPAVTTTPAPTTTLIPTTTHVPTTTPIPTTTTVPTTTPTSTTPAPTTTTVSPTTTTTQKKVASPRTPLKPSDQVTTTNASASNMGNSSESGDVTTSPPELVPTTTPKKPFTVGSVIDAVKNMTKIQFAYLIIGLLLLVNAIMFLILYCQDRIRGRLNMRNSDLQAQLHRESACFRVTMLCLLFLFFFLYVGMEVTLGGLLSTFAVKHMSWSKQQGAVLTAIFWGSIAAGRGLAIFVAKCFKPPCMLIIDLILAMVGALILSFAVTRFPMSLYAGTLIIGLGMSSIFPTGISWADYYFPLTGKATAVLVIGSALGEMVIPVVTGHFFSEDDQMSLMYVMLALTVSSFLLYWVMQCIALKKARFSGRSQGQFMPLQDEEENLAMDNLDEMSLGGPSMPTGYAEHSHKRTTSKVRFKDNDVAEYDRLVDIED